MANILEDIAEENKYAKENGYDSFTSTLFVYYNIYCNVFYYYEYY